MTNDDNLEWLRSEINSLDDGIVWTFPLAESVRLRDDRFVLGIGKFSELVECDLDEKMLAFRAAHPEIRERGLLWEPFIESVDGQELGEQATKTLNLMIQESSYEDVVYAANRCVYFAVARIEIGDSSASPVRATWHTRPTEASD